jgi:RNA polymerase sigma-70 factor (ECF subfamily)
MVHSLPRDLCDAGTAGLPEGPCYHQPMPPDGPSWGKQSPEPSGSAATTNETMGSLRLVHTERFPDVAGRHSDARPAGDDYALVAGIRRGDPTAAAGLFEKYRARVERTLVRLLGFDSELADAVQETFIRALESSRLLRDPQALPSWMIRIAVFTASDVIRRRKRRRWLQLFAEPQDLAEQSHALVFEAEPDLEARRALQAAQVILSALPTQERIAFSLRRLDGMELKEVAAACGCSLATVKRRLARAELRFRTRAAKHPALDHWLSAQREGEA